MCSAQFGQGWVKNVQISVFALSFVSWQTSTIPSKLNYFKTTLLSFPIPIALHASNLLLNSTHHRLLLLCAFYTMLLGFTAPPSHREICVGIKMSLQDWIRIMDFPQLLPPKVQSVLCTIRVTLTIK